MTNIQRFEILDARLTEFHLRMTKLNKTAKKLGCDELQIIDKVQTILHRTVPIEGTNRSRSVKYPGWIITVSCPVPKLGGWIFAAKIENLEAGVNLVHKVPGVEVILDARFRSAVQDCEHCNIKRFRKGVFVLVNEQTGEQVQVGRSCLKDFTGHSPEKMLGVLGWFNRVNDLGDERSYGGAIPNYVEISEVLALTSAYINRYGWISRAAVTPENKKVATADDVIDHFSFDPMVLKKAEEMMPVISQHAYEEADKVLEYWKNVEEQPGNDYQYNVKTILSQEMIQVRSIGIAASSVAGYHKAMDIKNAKEIKRASSKHIGIVGERIRDLEVTVDMIRALPSSEWGDRTLIQFIDNIGNVFVWFASGWHEYAKGTKLVITGSIKGHTTFNEIAQTQLTRVKIKHN